MVADYFYEKLDSEFINLDSYRGHLMSAIDVEMLITKIQPAKKP